MDKSTHKAEVIKIKMEPHPNADSLSVVRVDGYTVCVRTADWHDDDLAVHILPESIVDNTKLPFTFLSKPKIGVQKLRGIISFGLLVPAPEGLKEGDDVAEILGITHYEPVVDSCEQTDNVSSPPGFWPKYDLDTIRKYHKVFVDGEPILASEKVNGSLGRIVSVNDKLYVGSHRQWKKEDPRCIWWQALDNTPQIRTFTELCPNMVVYAELIGKVGGYQYGSVEPRYLCFDICDLNHQYLDVCAWMDTCRRFDIPMVPIIATNEPYNYSLIDGMSNGPSLVPGADHNREGCVVKPMKERIHDKIGRVILKCVGTDYLGKKH